MLQTQTPMELLIELISCYIVLTLSFGIQATPIGNLVEKSPSIIHETQHIKNSCKTTHSREAKPKKVRF